MRSTFVSAMTLVTSTVTAQWYGPGDIPVPEVAYKADRFWLCSGPCCAVDGDSRTGTAIVYYDGVGRDTYQVTGLTQEQQEAEAEAARLSAEAKAEADRLAAENKLEADRLAAEAKAEADRLEEEAEAEEDRLEAIAEAEAARLAAEAEARLTPEERAAIAAKAEADLLAAKAEAARFVEEAFITVQANIERITTERATKLSSDLAEGVEDAMISAAYDRPRAWAIMTSWRSAAIDAEIATEVAAVEAETAATFEGRKERYLNNAISQAARFQSEVEWYSKPESLEILKTQATSFVEEEFGGYENVLRSIVDSARQDVYLNAGFVWDRLMPEAPPLTVNGAPMPVVRAPPTPPFKQPDPKESTLQCYQRDTLLAQSSLQGTYELTSNGYTMRLQMALSVESVDQNTVIDNQEVAMMTVCYPRATDTTVFSDATNHSLSFLPTHDCCQASYTLEDYITGNYVVTAQCYLSPFASSVKPTEPEALVSSSQKRFEVCGAKLTDNLAAPTYKDVSLPGTDITLDERNTTGRTKSFAATFQWDLDLQAGFAQALTNQNAWMETSIQGRFLTNRRVLSRVEQIDFSYTPYDASTAAGAGFNPADLACTGGLQSAVASLAVVATALSFLSF